MEEFASLEALAERIQFPVQPVVKDGPIQGVGSEPAWDWLGPWGHAFGLGTPRARGSARQDSGWLVTRASAACCSPAQ
jgi:hypothetical protein